MNNLPDFLTIALGSLLVYLALSRLGKMSPPKKDVFTKFAKVRVHVDRRYSRSETDHDGYNR